ncbi:hypothetical protein [Paenibacillus arenosi]|uniref:Uncharacterized protein n=1 Tax=Paenibacillus arenosi TaxID=2774142 RepID=A0ABR9B015_9BACL|nr:hypothetical protein [Paenibacillus arenosi]MBD8498800.1 hypothetical protein [Paenibacillus arenosi]
MTRMDEKIIELLNRAQEESQVINPLELFEPNEEEVGTWFVQIGDERVLFEQKTILDGKATIRLPREFDIMEAKLASRKYPTDNRPELIYSNEAGTINLTFKCTEHDLNRMTLPDFKVGVIDIFKRSQPMARWIEDGIKEINERSIGYFSFIVPGLDTSMFNHMFFTYFDKKALLCTFNCMEEDMDDWKLVALAIVESFRIESIE